jgi:oligopeptidase A
MTNPLLDFSGLPAFASIQPAHVAPAVDALIAQADAALTQVTQPDYPADWVAVARVLDVATEKLGRAWGAVSHLNSVADSADLRTAFNEALPRITEFWTRMGADARLFDLYRRMSPETLNAEQRRAHGNALRNFVLSGAELHGEARERFAAIQERQAELSQKFSENSLDATDAWTYLASDDEVAGIPDDVLQTARQAAQADGAQGYKLTLKMPCYLPVMQYADSSALRETLYRAYSTRASDQAQGDAKRFDNTAIMADILALRDEEAQLLGYPSFAHVSLVPKMAESPDEVMAFLRNLASRARPYAQADVADMRAFAAEHLNIADPLPWDWPYIAEKLKEARYSFSEREVKHYFPAPTVLAGLFRIIETLFEVGIREDEAPVWHPSVRFYRLERKGQLIGQFYLDPGARQGKRGGAWMDDVRARWLRPDTGALQTPIAHLVCNFAEGVNGKPPLLTHDDVITLFHEFGHGLHHLLTQVNEHDVSGISGVEWDAVELPSQFMENFCWEWDVLKHMSSHVDTGESLPKALFERMLAGKNFQSGLQTLRQVEFSLFDMGMHHQSPPPVAVQAVLDAVRAEISVLQAPAFSRTANTFGHVFSGGYAAGYYSYKWAEVLSADAYSAFEETRLPDGSFAPETGLRYRTHILEAGGSRPAMESFKAFRGRPPTIDALLHHQGMSEQAH